MRIFVKVKTKTKAEKVERLDETHFAVSVKALPVDGKANEAIVKALASFLKVPKSSIRLLSGANGKSKVFDIV